MRKKTFISILTIILTITFLSSTQMVSAQSVNSDGNRLAENNSVIPVTENYSTWVWNTKAIINKENFVQELIDKKIKKVYLQINRDIPMWVYREFVQAAADNGIDVYALEGSPNWLNQNNNRSELLKKWIKKYQQTSLESEQFKGIHLDVEPYLNNLWKTNEKLAVRKYQDIISDYKSFSNRLNIAFEADIPFWFDGRYYNNWKYGKGQLSDWVIRNTDSVTIMAYRNFTEGNNGIIKLVADELEYAANLNKKVVIGVETKQSEIPYLTFFNMDLQLMNNVLNEVSTHYKETTSFGGLAIHSFESYQLMGQREEPLAP